jgi:N-acetylglucosaminyl-diphospho-decaprenol L-rhamnosyltransferase
LSTPQDDVDVVIVSYESRDFLVRCLDAWAATSVSPLVVDNGSTDDSVDVARAAGVDVLIQPDNLGFGAAANAGIAEGRAPFVLVTNADAWPQSPADVEMLVSRMAADDEIGAAGPAFVGIDGSPQPNLLPVAGRLWLGRPAVTSFPTGKDATHAPPALSHRPAYLVGAALLLRRAALEQVGAFDPAFFLFNEEVDLCLRIASSGRKLAYVPDSTFVHVGGVATRPRWRSAYREQLRGHLRLLDKHKGRASAEQARRVLAVSLRVRALLASEEQRPFLRESSVWLRQATVEQLLAERPSVRNDTPPR